MMATYCPGRDLSALGFAPLARRDFLAEGVDGDGPYLVVRGGVYADRIIYRDTGWDFDGLVVHRRTARLLGVPLREVTDLAERFRMCDLSDPRPGRNRG
jgi:hypothetical protein